MRCHGCRAWQQVDPLQTRQPEKGSPSCSSGSSIGKPSSLANILADLLWMMVVRTAVARKYIPTAHFPKSLGPFVESYPYYIVVSQCLLLCQKRLSVGNWLHNNFSTASFVHRSTNSRAIFVLRSALIFPAWFGQIGHRSEAEYRFGRLPAYSSILGRLLTCLQAFAIRLAVKAVQFRVLKLERFHATHLRFAPEKFMTTSAADTS